MEYSLDRRLAVEFIGVVMFVFVVGMVTQKATGAGPLAPLAIGFVLMVLVLAGGHISGGHYNPAVSTAVLIRERMSANEWFGYVVIQLIAAVLGGLLVRAIGGPESAVKVASTGKMPVVQAAATR
jgi:aquaporin Z